MFGGAIAVQAVLSATNLIVGLILIRRAPDAQYGYYVLALNVITLLTALQNSFVQSQMVDRMTGATAPMRADLIGGLYRSQRRQWPILGAASCVGILICWSIGLLQSAPAIVALVAVIAALASLYREFFRMVLLAYRRPDNVLRADLAFAIILILGATIATLTPKPAAVVILFFALAALTGALICSLSLWRFAPWNIDGAPGILKAILPFAVWTTSGCAIHWVFSQGYNFLVAGTLGVTAVAAVAATRTLIMPVNLLSTGIGTLMLPTVSNWLQAHDPRLVLNRQLLIAGALAAVAACYFTGVWIFRDWIFTNVLNKTLAQRDLLLLLWFAVGILMLLRDQLVYLLLSRSRVRALTILTLASALVSLATSYLSMRQIGAPGALVGVLVGELVNVSGLIILSIGESRRSPRHSNM